MEQMDLFASTEPTVRHARSPYGWRASIDVPSGPTLHVNERSLFLAVKGVKAKYAAYLEVSRTFGWDRQP